MVLRGFALLKESVGAREESRRLWQDAHDLYVKVDVPAGVGESAALRGNLPAPTENRYASHPPISELPAYAGTAYSRVD